jgi:hypothetical protein
MGLYDRDYMREERPARAPGGDLGFVIFLVLLLALSIYVVRRHPAWMRAYVVRPWAHLAHRMHPVDRKNPPRRSRRATTDSRAAD